MVIVLMITEASDVMRRTKPHQADNLLGLERERVYEHFIRVLVKLYGIGSGYNK